MKAFIALFILAINLNAFSSETRTCKAQAHAAANEAYLSQVGEDAMIFSQSKFKPLIDGAQIIHLVQINDVDRGASILTVTLNKFNCRVISID